MRINAVILAGGEGRRMGGADKALLPLNGRSLLAHVLYRLTPQVGAVAISANGNPARFAAFGLPVLPDAQSLGPLSGVLAGLCWAVGHGADALLTVPVDVPFLPADLAARLAAAAAGDAPVLAECEGRLHPATALWPVALVAPLAEFLASGARPKVTDFAFAHGACRVPFPDAGAFANLNTLQDIAAATIAGGSA